MSSDAFVKIIGAILTIIITLVSVYVIPAIKANMTQKDMDTLMYYLSIAVRCADQIYTADEWKEKKQYVVDYLTRVVDEKLNIKLTEQDINTLIEGVVNEIHENGVKP